MNNSTKKFQAKAFLITSLRLAFITAALIVLAISIGVSLLAVNTQTIKPSLIFLMIGTYPFTITTLVLLYQGMKLLEYISKERTFSNESVYTLKIISRCAAVIFIICMITGLPLSYILAQLNDAPGLVILGLILTGFSLVLTIFFYLLTIIWTEVTNTKSKA